MPATAIRLCAAAAALVALCARSAPAEDEVPRRAMKDELARSMGQLRLQGMDRPYFIAYRMDEVDASVVSAALGGLTNSQHGRTRLVAVELRVGDYALDNSNYFSTRSFGRMDELIRVRQAPVDDDYQQIRRQFWLATDAQYKRALEDLSAKRAALRMRTRGEKLPDFSREPPVTAAGPRASGLPARAELEALAREVSAIFQSVPEIQRSVVRIAWQDVYTRYVNSEGTSFTRARPTFQLEVDAETQAADGMPISDSIEIHGHSAAELPPRQALLVRVRDMAARILALRSAPSVERYNGPVLFEGVAAAEVFGQHFAARLVAVRQPVGDDPRFDLLYGQMMGSSFADRIGGRVLPEFLGVTDDPGRTEVRGTPLLGGRPIDDDGVVPRETKLVEHGVLKTLLATRVPVRSVPRSTGSRRGCCAAPSNLVVTSDRSVGGAELRRELLRRAKERGLDYGIVVRRMGGGGAAASMVRAMARMAGQAQPGSGAMAEVYLLRPDGREEPLRGMGLGEMTPAAFKGIVAVGDTPAVFTGEFAHQLGGIFSFGFSAAAGFPVVSCVAPSMLFEEVSLVRSQGPFPDLPVSPSPLVAR